MFRYLALSFRSRGHLGCFSLPFHCRMQNANYANFVYSATLQLQHTKRVLEGGEVSRAKGGLGRSIIAIDSNVQIEMEI